MEAPNNPVMLHRDSFPQRAFSDEDVGERFSGGGTQGARHWGGTRHGWPAVGHAAETRAETSMPPGDREVSVSLRGYGP